MTDVADRVRLLVADGELAPGEQLIETAMADRLGVSRNTLREAFRALAAEGLVVHHRHRGVFVQAPSEQDVHDLYAARRAVECGAVREAGLQVDRGCSGAEAVERLSQCVARAATARSVGDHRGVADLNTDFHRTLIGLPDVPTLAEWGERLLARARLAFRSHRVPEELHSTFVPRNQVLVEQLAAGDYAQAADELGQYLLVAEAEVVGGIRAAREG